MKKIPKTDRPTPCSFVNLPIVTDWRELDAQAVIFGIPHGKPYQISQFPNDQSRAPNALEQPLHVFSSITRLLTQICQGRILFPNSNLLMEAIFHLLETIFSGIMMMLKKLCVTPYKRVHFQSQLEGMMALQTLSLGGLMA